MLILVGVIIGEDIRQNKGAKAAWGCNPVPGARWPGSRLWSSVGAAGDRFRFSC
jgi:hypothetical protein